MFSAIIWYIPQHVLVYEMSSSVDLSQSQFVVIFVVQNVHQVCVKRMNVLEMKIKNYNIHINSTYCHTV